MPDILTPKEAAYYLRMQLCTLRKLVNCGQVPCVKVTRKLWIFRKSSLDRWLEQKES